jgi:hypothetical protein
MRFAGFVLILGERPCLRAMPRGLRRQVHVHEISPSLTSLAPQLSHRTANACRFPWSGGFDRIFRNEGVAYWLRQSVGSNPVSFTETDGQGDFCAPLTRSIHDPEVSRSTGGPQIPASKHLISGEVLLTEADIKSAARKLMLDADPDGPSEIRDSPGLATGLHSHL